MLTDEQKRFSVYINKIAKKMEDNAAYGGRMDDGGGGILRLVMDAWISGIEGVMPRYLESHYKRFDNEEDPEYDTYQRLKKKFEG